MKKSNLIILTAIISFIVVLSLVILFINLKTETYLEFSVIDSVSRGKVWDCTIEFQKRYNIIYYQSSKAPVKLKLTHLYPGPGNFDLKITAPEYEEQIIPVKIKSGKNVLPEPIEMKGLRIPDLARFFVILTKVDNSYKMEFRPVKVVEDNTLNGILRHPGIDIWIGCKMYVQTLNGVFVKEKNDERAEKGELLFNDIIKWEWDSSIDNPYPYTGFIQGAKIKEHNSPFRYFEFLIVVPDPRKITKDELNRGLADIMSLNDQERLKLLDSYKDKIVYFIDEQWNVPALK